MQAAFADMQRTVIPQATESTMGGVIVGDGLNVDNALLSLANTKSKSGTSVFSNGSYLESLTVYGESVQDDTPTLDAPVPVQVVEGPLSLVIGDSSMAINLQGNTIASLPDGTRDELYVDSTGHCVLTKRVGQILTPTNVSNVNNLTQVTGGARWNVDVDGLASEEIPNGSTNGYCSHTPFSRTLALGSLGSHIFTFGGKIYYIIEGDFTASTAVTWVNSHQMTIIYPLATPQTIDLGYIDPPAIPEDGAMISVSASITPVIDVSWWENGAAAVASAISKLMDEIQSLKAQIAALATS